MNEERRMILEMVKDGAISIEEAEKLLTAVPSEENSEPSSDPLMPRRISVLVTENGRSRVNVKIPFALVRTGLKLGKTFGALGVKYTEDSPEKQEALALLRNIDVDDVIHSIMDGDITLPCVLVDVDEEEKGQHIRIELE